MADSFLTGFYICKLILAGANRIRPCVRFNMRKLTIAGVDALIDPHLAAQYCPPAGVFARNAVTKQSVSPFTRSRGTDRVASLAMTPGLTLRGIGANRIRPCVRRDADK